MSGNVLEVEDLNVSFQTDGGTVHAVRDLSLTVAARRGHRPRRRKRVGQIRDHDVGRAAP